MCRILSTTLALVLAVFGCAKDRLIPESAPRERAPDDRRALELEMARLRGRIVLLEQEVERGQDREKWLKFELARLGEPVAEMPEIRPTSKVPPIEAAVAEVCDDISPKAVALDRGLLDGVDRGLQFTIYRGQTFVGKVVVEKADERRATARILFTAPGRAIERGDKAATRLD